MKSLHFFSKTGQDFPSPGNRAFRTSTLRTALIALIFLVSNSSFSKYLNMGSLNEFGGGNYYVHVNSESDAKRIITEKVKLNGIPSRHLQFHKGSSLYFCSYHVNPLNNEYVYFITCLPTREGWDVWFYYIENRYRYFYDVNSGGNRIPVVYDPAILESRNETPVKKR